MNSASDSPSDSQASMIANIQHAMSLQRALGGKHEEMLRSLVEINTTLLKQVSVLTSSLSDISAWFTQLAALPPIVTTISSPVVDATSSMITREPSVPVPGCYFRDPGACQAFIVQCSLVFELLPHI